jgi:NAD(P)-dependent dehydrogenase (short-subunit alcohol dehydrogenase family)
MENKVALVTGGGSGIGRATALAFAREGAKVVVADAVVKGGKKTIQMIKERGGEGIFVKAEVTLASEVKAMVHSAIQTYGRLDYAHNNAGIEADRASIVDCPEEDWDRIIGVNLKGTWLCMKYEIPQMLKQGKGAIVNMSSIAGLGAAPDCSPYVASKHGVIGITRAAAVEYTKAGIRINALCPGMIVTPMLERLSGGDPRSSEALLHAQEPIGRLGTPEEVAEAVVWLCSDSASFVSGHAMVVDGGKTVLHTA